MDLGCRPEVQDISDGKGERIERRNPPAEVAGEARVGWMGLGGPGGC